MYVPAWGCVVTQDMMTFTSWFLVNLPEFLLSPPISAFTGLAILFVVVRLVHRMIRI